MTQWAEIRHLHLVEGVSKKQIARRLQLDIKTVRRALEQPTPPARASSPRVRSLDPWREQIAQWLDQDRRLTAKRIRRLLLPLAGPVAARTVRRYVAALKVATAPKEGYVHRSVRPGTTMEVDFGESWAEVAGVPRKVKYLVATLPYSNVYFAKAYPLERLESLLDGIESAFTYFGGVVDRVVLDNTSLAVKAVLAGRDRLETEAFAAFRGAYPFGPSSVRRRRAGRRARSRRASSMCATWCSGRGWRWRAGRRSMRCSSRSWRPTCRRATSTTGARCRTRGGWSGSICGRCPCIVPRPAASSRGWPTSSGMCGWTMRRIRCRSATPTSQYG